jgi:predicted RNA-binding protein with PIN domain
VASYMIVDGHSVIFAWEDLRELHARNAQRARQELVDRLTRYQDVTGTSVVVVFDGRGGRRFEPVLPDPIQVLYSKSGQTADDVIERLAAKYASEHDFCVVTDDSLERQTVISFGASSISTDSLRGRLESSERELQREIQRRNKRA